MFFGIDKGFWLGVIAIGLVIIGMVFCMWRLPAITNDKTDNKNS